LRYNANGEILGRGEVTLFSTGLAFSMLSRAHRLVFAIGLLAVLVVFIAPSVDLPATALSAQQNAQCIMFGITLLRAAILFAMVLFFHERGNLDISARSVLRLHPLLCSFLC
jgi:lipoprotein signal peptidase